MIARWESRRKGTSWQRDRIVGGSRPSSSATSTITAYGGRLLEVLEQRVGGVLVQQVRRGGRGRRGARPRTGACAGRGGARGSGRCGSGRRAARGRRGRDGRRARRGPRRRAARRRTRARSRRFPTPARPVEEVGVRRPLGERRAEEALGLVLLREGLEAVHGRSRRYLRASGCRRPRTTRWPKTRAISR